LGVLDLGTHAIETAEEVAARIERALPYVDAERLIPAPDCGMKYMPREVAFGKLKAMAAGAAIVREKLGGWEPLRQPRLPGLNRAEFPIFGNKRFDLQRVDKLSQLVRVDARLEAEGMRLSARP